MNRRQFISKISFRELFRFFVFKEGGFMITKRELREEIKKKRKLLSSSYKENSSKKIAKHVTDSEEFRRADSVFIYVSTPDEPDTSEIISRALCDGKKVYVPKCLKKGLMIPVPITETSEFESGYMGIREPAEYDGNIITEKIGLSVIPCVSASLSGERLGHGAAFYDIFLKKTETVKLCLSFGELLSENIPTDENDIKADAVITENGIFYT